MHQSPVDDATAGIGIGSQRTPRYGQPRASDAEDAPDHQHRVPDTPATRIDYYVLDPTDKATVGIMDSGCNQVLDIQQAITFLGLNASCDRTVASLLAGPELLVPKKTQLLHSRDFTRNIDASA